MATGYAALPLRSPSNHGLGGFLTYLEPQPELFTGRKADQGSSTFETYFDLTRTQLRFIFNQVVREQEQLLDNNQDSVKSSTEEEQNDQQIGLSFDAVQKALRVVGLKVRDQSLFLQLMAKVDKNGDQLISFEEFETVVQSLKLEYLFRSQDKEQTKTSGQGILRSNEFGVGQYGGVKVHHDIKAFVYSDRQPWVSNKWIHLQRPDPFVLKALTIKYRLHPLALEAILEPTRFVPMRARVEQFDGQLFVVFPVLGYELVKPSSDVSGSENSKQYFKSRQRYARSGILSKSSELASKRIGTHRTSVVGATEKSPLLEPEQQELEAGERMDIRRNSRTEVIVGPSDMLLPVMNRGTLSMFLSYPELDTLITVSDGDCVSVVQQAESLLKVPYSRPRSQNSMFLLYTLLDLAVDDYSNAIEVFADCLSELRVRLRDRTSKSSLLSRSKSDQLFYAAHHHVTGEILTVRRWLQPASRVVQHLLQEHDFAHNMKLYLRDVRDHLEQVNDDVICLLDDCRSIKEEYDHGIEIKQNSAMTVVTLLATTFLPAQFLTGVFGMNFKSMPELQWEWGYPLFWALCFLSWITIFALFKWRF